MNDMSVFDAYARSLGNALVLKGLLELLRDKGVVSAVEVHDVLRRASSTLSSRPSVPAIRNAKAFIDEVLTPPFEPEAVAPGQTPQVS